jgi:hypothetical protein
VQFVVLDMVEEADPVAVRWQLSAIHQGATQSRIDWRSTASRTGASPRTGESLFADNGLIDRKITPNLCTGSGKALDDR